MAAFLIGDITIFHSVFHVQNFVPMLKTVIFIISRNFPAYQYPKSCQMILCFVELAL